MSGRSDWDDVDLSQYWDNDYEEETPALLHLWDGLGAAYVSKINTFIGEPASV